MSQKKENKVPELKNETLEATTNKQPDVEGRINENIVNPVAPVVEPQGVKEATVRKVAVPDAKQDPTVDGDNGRYDRLLNAFNKLANHGNPDQHYLGQLRKDAGIV